ncbi:MAG: hypothetical protein ABFR31_00120 [Thermodesulfobacteriota bacterium]
MSLINTVSPENAESVVKETYDMMMDLTGEIPEPIELWSASPGLLKHRRDLLEYYLSSGLSTALLAFIRYIAASMNHSGACSLFNARLLQSGGMTDANLEAIQKDASSAPLDDKEKKMLTFVLKVVKDSDNATQEDVDELRELGWSDKQIFDAVHQGVDMILVGKMMNIFKM